MTKTRHDGVVAKDFLDELIDDRTRRNSRFPDLVAEAERRREMARRLADQRHARGLSQTVVAARMRTAASVVSKLESGADVKLSTLQRYCAAIGKSFEYAVSPPRRPGTRRRSAKKSA
jgi:ribosome-binding protein aMBF1 (putative translation factor)